MRRSVRWFARFGFACVLCAPPVFAQTPESPAAPSGDVDLPAAPVEAPATPPASATIAEVAVGDAAESDEDAAPSDPAPEPAPVPPPPLPTGQVLFDRYASQLVVMRYTADLPQPGGEARAAHQLGVFVDADGLVLVPGYAQSLSLKPRDFLFTVGDETYGGDLLRQDGQLNLSYVRITPPEDDTAPAFDAVSFAEPVTLEVGEDVWVFGMLPEQAGFAKQLRRRRVAAVLEDPSTVYVLDGTPDPRDAGGLVLTLDGRPAGVVGYELTTQQGGELYVRHGMPLIFPAALLAKHILEPRDTEAAPEQQAWFGILVQPLRPDFKEYFGLEDETGCIVSNVVRGSPAERAGLERGDIVVAFNGENLDVPNDLAVLTFTRSVRDLPLDTPIPIQYLRDGELRDATVELSPVPKTAARADNIRQPAWGLLVRELTQDVVYLANLPPDMAGVVVDGVEPGGPAQAAGLQPGDIIRELNSTPVDSLGAYGEAIDQLASMRSEKIVLFIQRNQRTGFTTLEPDWRLPAREDD